HSLIVATSSTPIQQHAGCRSSIPDEWWNATWWANSQARNGKKPFFPNPSRRRWGDELLEWISEFGHRYWCWIAVDACHTCYDSSWKLVEPDATIPSPELWRATTDSRCKLSTIDAATAQPEHGKVWWTTPSTESLYGARARYGPTTITSKWI